MIASSDDGTTWTGHAISDVGVLNLLGVGCQSKSFCLVGGMEDIQSNPAGQGFQANQAVIWKTTNGGSTWSKTMVPLGVAGIAAIACPTSTRCIAVGSSVLESNDAGQTWTIMPVKGGANQLLSITCPTASTCIAVGPNAEGPFNPALPGDATETTDGGATFSDVTLPGATASVFQVACQSTTRCYAGGAAGNGATTPVFVSSTDGGSTWGQATPPSQFKNISSISCASGASCVAVGDASSGSSTTASSASIGAAGQWSSTSTSIVSSSSN